MKKLVGFFHFSEKGIFVEPPGSILDWLGFGLTIIVSHLDTLHISGFLEKRMKEYNKNDDFSNSFFDSHCPVDIGGH